MLLDEKALTLTFNAKIYPLEAVMAAAYSFLERAYVLLDRSAKGDTVVRLWPREGQDARVTEGDFTNELLNEALRLKVAKRNQQVREMVINRALFAASNVSVEDEVLNQALDNLEDLDKLDVDLDKLDVDLDSENLDFLDDPLGIAVPWEEKYGKDKKEGAAAPAEAKPAEAKAEDKGEPK